MKSMISKENVGKSLSDIDGGEQLLRYSKDLWWNQAEQVEDMRDNCVIITVEHLILKELEFTITTLKNYKSCRVDEINSELLKYSRLLLSLRLLQLFSEYWHNLKVTDKLATGTSLVVPIFKKGNRTDPKHPNTGESVSCTLPTKCKKLLIIVRLVPITNFKC